MATLRFSFGTMGSGKSTLALQIHHNLASRHLYGLLLTRLDRDGVQVTSRLGVAAPAIQVEPDLDIHALSVHHWPLHYDRPGTTPVWLEKGAEMGRFNMGSTVVLLFGPGAVSWAPRLLAHGSVRMGESIGTWSAGATG